MYEENQGEGVTATSFGTASLKFHQREYPDDEVTKHYIVRKKVPWALTSTHFPGVRCRPLCRAPAPKPLYLKIRETFVHNRNSTLVTVVSSNQTPLFGSIGLDWVGLGGGYRGSLGDFCFLEKNRTEERTWGSGGEGDGNAA